MNRFLSGIKSLFSKSMTFEQAVKLFTTGTDGIPSISLPEAYAQSVWVNAAIKSVVSPIKGVPLRFVAGDNEIEDGPLIEWWKQPAIGCDFASFVEASCGWQKLSGETFWLLDDTWFTSARDKSKMILARPTDMREIVQAGELVGWVYTDAGGKQHSLLPEEVVHIKQWNPYNRWRGLGELAVAKIAAETDYAAGRYARDTFRNAGDAGAYVTSKNGVPSEAQQQQIIAALRDKRTSRLRGDYRPVFLAGDIQVTDPKVAAPDAGFNQTRILSRHEVFIAFGVPASMADVVASYSIGSASDMFRLISNTCVPLAKTISGTIDKVLVLQYGRTANVSCYFDWDEHPTMQEVRKERIASAKELFSMGMPVEKISEYLQMDLPEYAGWENGYTPVIGNSALAETQDSVEETGGAEPTPPPEPNPTEEDLDVVRSIEGALKKRVEALKGGPGSGNFGHEGRPGEVGGSSNEGSGDPVVDAFRMGTTMPNAGQSRKWAEKYRELYENDPEFRAAVDVATIYAGGEFDDIAAADRAASGEITREGRAILRGEVQNLTNPIATYGGNPFYADDKASDTAIQSSTSKIADGISGLNRAYDGSSPSPALYRGITLPATPDGMMRFFQAQLDEGVYATGEERSRAEANMRKLKNVQKSNEKILNLKQGDTLRMDGFTSFTTKESVAVNFSEQKTKAQRGGGRSRGSTAVVFEVERGAKAVGISRFSNWNQAEAITKGRFEVTQVTKDSARGTMRVGLRQVASHSLKQLVQNEDLSASFAEFYPSLDLEWYGKESSGTDPAELFVIVAEVEREMSKEGVEASEQEPEAKSAEFPTPERRSLWEKVTKRRAASEKRLISKLSRVLNDVRVETLANIEKADLDNAKMLETKAAPVDVVFRFDPFLNQWTKVTRAASTEMLTESVEETRSELEEELNLDEPSAVPVPPQSRNPWKLPPEKAMQFLQERENLMKGIADEIHKEIMDSIAQGMADGIGAAGIAESVKKKFNEISNGRAKTIARTETGAAYGFARQASLEATTIQYKQWLATPDARCRPSHVAADGQVVPMNVPFKVGGASLMYPCDPSGPLDEIINCRCVQLAVVRP